MNIFKPLRMGYYSSFQDANTQGVFLRHESGYYYFRNTQNDEHDEIVFEEVNKKVLEKYDLRTLEFKGKKFQLYYTEIMEDLDDEDFIVLRLDDLELT
ncbi:hypothetical protein [Tenacibaculum sp. 190130A14a]